MGRPRGGHREKHHLVRNGFSIDIVSSCPDDLANEPCSWSQDPHLRDDLGGLNLLALNAPPPRSHPVGTESQRTRTEADVLDNATTHQLTHPAQTRHPSTQQTRRRTLRYRAVAKRRFIINCVASGSMRMSRPAVLTRKRGLVTADNTRFTTAGSGGGVRTPLGEPEGRTSCTG